MKASTSISYIMSSVMKRAYKSFFFNNDNNVMSGFLCFRFNKNGLLICFNCVPLKRIQRMNKKSVCVIDVSVAQWYQICLFPIGCPFVGQ